MGFAEALLIVFIILKVLGLIDWSWWLVLSPMIISLVVLIFAFLGSFIWFCKTRR